MKKLILPLILLLFVLGACSNTDNQEASGESGENWPNDRMEFVVPYAEGGSADVMARGLASHWQELLNEQIIIRNVAGGASALGTEQFLQQDADGHTYLLGAQPALSMSIEVFESDYTLEDFEFINVEQRDFASIVVPKDSPYETLDDLIKDIQERPGEIKMSITSGAGHSLFGYAFVDELDLDVNTISFASGGEQRTDIIGGHSDFAISGAHGDLAIQDEIRLLAVASEEEFPGWEGVPPANVALEGYDINPLPAVGDNRFIAVHREFVEQNPEVYEDIVQSYKENFESDVYQEYMEDIGVDPLSEYYGPEKSLEIIMELDALVQEYSGLLSGIE